MAKKETVQLFCMYCHKVFEAESIAVAIEMTKGHEKECPKRKS